MKKIKFLILLLVLMLSSFPLFTKEKVRVGIYQDAVVYTGVTQYIFQDSQTGKTFQISVPFEERNKFSIPKNLLEDPNDVEGVVGANPKMIGKKFTITEVPKGITKIAPAFKK